MCVCSGSSTSHSASDWTTNILNCSWVGLLQAAPQTIKTHAPSQHWRLHVDALEASFCLSPDELVQVTITGSLQNVMILRKVLDSSLFLRGFILQQTFDNSSIICRNPSQINPHCLESEPDWWPGSGFSEPLLLLPVSQGTTALSTWTHIHHLGLRSRKLSWTLTLLQAESWRLKLTSVSGLNMYSGAPRRLLKLQGRHSSPSERKEKRLCLRLGRPLKQQRCSDQNDAHYYSDVLRQPQTEILLIML